MRSMDDYAQINTFVPRQQAIALTAVINDRIDMDVTWLEGETDFPDGTGTTELRLQSIQAEGIRKMKAETGEVTWADHVLEDTYAALASDNPGELAIRLVSAAATMVAWLEALQIREENELEVASA